ncbi:MAG: tetratricopeptide repeat protein [Acidobacteria bacterium]|nr:tetratricopeptide repeat protein [Acidobacteriota bacterium]
MHSQSVQLPYGQNLIVKLGQAPNLVANLSPVSLSRLQHKIPRQAIKEYVAAHEASRKGERNKAISHLQKAIEIDPDYFEAHNNLGVQWMREGKAAEAINAFERAIAIDAGDSLAETNLSVALLSLGRFAEAETAARAGLRGDALSARARLYLALSLLEQKKGRKEVLFHLSKASSQLEPARKLLEQLEREGQK